VLITITATINPATDLGFLLHKHPDRSQSFDVAAGTAHVFYPAVTESECTVALLLEVDPIRLVRGRRDMTAFTLGQFVNDRPYSANSLLAVALGTVFRTAMAGRCTARPELAAAAIPLTVRVPALPSRGGPELASRLFEPLGWRVELDEIPLDATEPQWGASRYLATQLTGTLRLADALNQLYVLLPALDGAKHYWVNQDEVDKLLRAGGTWLAGHPERELITDRYLVHQKALTRPTLERLAESDDSTAEQVDDALAEPVVTEAPGNAIPLAGQRRGAVLAVLRAAGARRVLDLGCGSGALLSELLDEPAFTEIVGVDVAVSALAAAERRLRLDRLPDRQRGRITLRQSALTYADPALAGFDAAVLMEVIEHVDPPRLPALERAVFGVARPAMVVVTTPNVEYNVRFPALGPGGRRHPDHRFEWTRAEFAAWAGGVATEHGYDVRFLPVGAEDPRHGPPTQLAVFTVKEVA
jgi:3' terminal RNA ribose 2'-O-methyltransferase Hen1